MYLVIEILYYVTRWSSFKVKHQILCKKIKKLEKNKEISAKKLQDIPNLSVAIKKIENKDDEVDSQRKKVIFL